MTGSTPKKLSEINLLSIKDFSGQLKLRLQKPLPGEKAQKLTRIEPPINFSFSYSLDNAKPAGVLILLFPLDGTIHFYLTERTHSVEHHKGQISLPGGTWEPNEELFETAIRETEEEIGIPKDTVNFIGDLTPYFTPVTGYLIHPFIGWTKFKPIPKIHDGEVQKLFSVSVAELIEDKTLVTEDWDLLGYTAAVPFYHFNGHKVWGATAAILSEFRWMIKEMVQ